jgi:hypothetical protein
MDHHKRLDAEPNVLREHAADYVTDGGVMSDE